MAFQIFFSVIFLTALPVGRGCGLIPAGQGRIINFNLSNLILPAALAYSQDMSASSIAPTISKTEEEARAFVQRMVEQLVEDVLYQQGRSALLSDDVISVILRQVDVRATHTPLKCDKVLDEFNNKGTMSVDNCLIVKGTVTQICKPAVAMMCQMMMYVKSVPTEHLYISGSITTTNTVMASWSKEMWQIVLTRVLRILKSGPLASSFFKASVTIN